jgi:hypothetical protein
MMSTLTTILFFGGYLMPELVVNDTFINQQSIVLALNVSPLYDSELHYHDYDMTNLCKHVGLESYQ